jgi:hypothetical protein
LKEIEGRMLESDGYPTTFNGELLKLTIHFFRPLVSSALPKNAPSRLALPVSEGDKNSKDLASVLVNEWF